MIPFKMETQNINGLYKKGKLWMAEMTEVNQIDAAASFFPSLQHILTEFLFMCIGTKLFSQLFILC